MRIFLMLLLLFLSFNLKPAETASGGSFVEDANMVVAGTPLFSWSMKDVSNYVWRIYKQLKDHPNYINNKEELKWDVCITLVYNLLDKYNQNLNDLGSKQNEEILKYIADVVDNHEAMEDIDIEEV